MNIQYEETNCPDCSGSGEGMHEDTTCRSCRGSGTAWVEVEEAPELELEEEDETA